MRNDLLNLVSISRLSIFKTISQVVLALQALGFLQKSFGRIKGSVPPPYSKEKYEKSGTRAHPPPPARQNYLIFIRPFLFWPICPKD